MTVNVSEALKEFIRNLMTDRDFAGQYAEDPHGMLAAQGVTDHDLSRVDVPGAVRDVCGDPSVPAEARTAVQNNPGPASTGGATQSVESVVQHLNHITYATYEGDDYITNLIDQSVDNSVDVDIDGNVFGPVDVNAVTGEQGQIIDGPNFGQANTGDGAVQAGDDAQGVNTGINTGINAGDDVDIDDSAVAFGDGDATNVSGNTVDDGSAIAVGGNASGTNIEDNDVTNDNDITTVTTISDNDTTVNDNDFTVEDNDTAVTAVQDNDTVVSGEDTLAVQ